MNTKKKLKEIRTYAITIGLLFCTVVSGYGIFTAPKSDRAELEQELMRNEQSLRQIEFTPTGTAEEGQEGDNEIKKKTKTISVIGDSVFLGAAPSFQKKQKNAVIDAKISRQVYHGIDVAKEMKKKKKLGDIVIISLGTNGKFHPATGQALIDYLGTAKTIYWVNVYGKELKWQNTVNNTIQKLAEKNSNVHVISWAKKAENHPDWFYQDGIHLNTKGQNGFSKFVRKSVATAEAME